MVPDYDSVTAEIPRRHGRLNDFGNIVDTATTLLTAFGLRILGAIAAWIIGRALIKLGVRQMLAALGRQRLEPTIARYAGTS